MPFNKNLLIAGIFSQQTQRVYQYQSGNTLFQKFMQAVIDDDIETVVHILNKDPANLKLLLTEPKRNNVVASNLIKGLKFIVVENPLLFVIKRKQVGIIPGLPGMSETLLSYFDRLRDYLDSQEQICKSLEQTPEVIRKKNIVIADRDKLFAIRAHALNSKKNYKYRKFKYRKLKFRNEPKIVIPEEYSSYLQSLIRIFSQETFPNRNANGNPIFSHLSPQTEEALNELLSKLIPEEPIKLDDYLDVELFLLAAMEVYQNNLFTFQGQIWQQQAFCTRVFGLIERVQTRKIAEALCIGLFQLENNQISDEEIHQASQLLIVPFKNNPRHLISYYPESRSDPEGIGSSFWVEICGRPGTEYWRPWEEFLEQKQKIFKNTQFLPTDLVYPLMRSNNIF